MGHFTSGRPASHLTNLTGFGASSAYGGKDFNPKHHNSSKTMKRETIKGSTVVVTHRKVGGTGHVHDTNEYHHKSVVRELGGVSFPRFRGERIYMVPFTKGKPMPDILKRWYDTIGQMVGAIQVPLARKMYAMIDEQYVHAGTPHRRPGPHIDGNWVEDMSKVKVMYPETILLASSVAGCIAYEGEYEGKIGDGGDCSHLDLSKMKKITLKPGRVYAMNVMGVHSSVPVVKSGPRTLVRINIPRHLLT